MGFFNLSVMWTTQGSIELKAKVREEISNIASGKGYDKHQQTACSVYGQWGTSPNWFYFQK